MRSTDTMRSDRGRGVGVIGGWTAAALLGLSAGLATPAQAQWEESPGVILQWFEQRWVDMERKVPDFFMGGYGAVWLPPISKTFDPASPGYDPFNRFDLGSPDAPTAYGTEAYWTAARRELQRAGGLVYVDIIMNHNSGRQTGADFQQRGGYPGFWMGPVQTPFKPPVANWGDFHAGVAGGFLQSENPGGPRYDTLRGDLVALIDIDQSSNHFFIRQPVESGNPDNIPAGTVYNRPNAENFRFYPDQSLPAQEVVNPGTFRNPGTFVSNFHPFNLSDPMQGDPVVENATGYLERWTRWMLDVQKVDGFRLDAAKHIPSWFWDNIWDSSVSMRWERPDGQMATPFSFGESTAGNQEVFDNYVRRVTGQNRPGDSFGNRDTLDLAGAGALRNLINANGFGNWADVLYNSGGGHIDLIDDGFNNGSLGVFHAFSHDNGTVGDGNSMPPLPTEKQMGYFVHAYLLMRTGETIVYHNSRGIPRSFGFFPREGTSTALGWNPTTGQPDDTMTRLVQLRNQYARGWFIPLNSNVSDVLVFERRTPSTGRANVLVAVNDRYDAGQLTVNVNTGYPAGTRLVELTGNAANPQVNPGGAIPQQIQVGPGGQVQLVVPNNSNASGEHNRGYVIYGEALPNATLTLSNVGSTIPGDLVTNPGANPASSRLTSIPVITSNSFEIQVQTSQGLAVDPNSIDSNAAFRINAGFEDWNGNGQVDYPWGHTLQGFENFTTVNSPLAGGGQGLYVQEIDATQLDEGLNYITVAVLKQRAAGDDPLFRELRQVVYIDRLPPEVELVGGDNQIITAPIAQFRAQALDRTVRRVHMIVNLPEAANPVAAATGLNITQQRDRDLFRTNLAGWQAGKNRLTLVAFEENGTPGVHDYSVYFRACEADLTGPALDGLPDGVVNASDLNFYIGLWLDGDPAADLTGPSLDGTPDGVVNASDLNYYLGLWIDCN